jgi:hypothetical protein
MVSFAKFHQFLCDGLIGSPGAGVRASRYLMIAILAILLETIDPLMCSFPGYAESLG